MSRATAVLMVLSLVSSSGISGSPQRKPEPVAVVGQVKKPGIVPFRTNMTVRQAIRAAGGLRDDALGEKGTLRRLGASLRPVDVARAVAGDKKHDLPLKAGDTLVVPPVVFASDGKLSPSKGAKRQVDPSSRVAIVGEVLRPGSYLYEPMMVREALAAAGGPTVKAETKGIRIRRGYLIDPPSARTFTYNYQRVVENKQPDVALLPGDAIEIPRKGKKTVFGSLIGALNRAERSLRPITKPLAQAGAATAAGIPPEQAAAGVVLKSGSKEVTGGRVPTALETALFQAIAAEKAEVRERIYARTNRYLESRER